MDVSEVLSDLQAEQSALDDLVAPLSDEQWDLATASPRWSVTDQIGHLTYFDTTAALAITDPDGFKASVAELMAQMTGGEEAADEATLGDFRSANPADRLNRWRHGRSLLAEAGSTLKNDTRVVWYGPSMGSKSFLTARLMECWAHGQDVADAVGASREATDRIRHIAQLGVITRGWTYMNRGLEVPEGDVQVTLEAPSGAQWQYGADGAAETVSGTAEDFCLVVTQRRNVHDTNLTATPLALDWLEKAQAFAGAATDPPPSDAQTA